MTGNSLHGKAQQELQKVLLFPCGREDREVMFAVKRDELATK